MSRSIKPHQLSIDEISHMIKGLKSRFRTKKHRGKQAGAFGGKTKVARE